MTISAAIEALARTFTWTALYALAEPARLALIEDAAEVEDFTQYARDIGDGNLEHYAQTLLACKRRGGFASSELDAICGEMPDWMN